MTAANDPDLASIVQITDAFGLEYDVVLTLAGLVVSGTLIGARAHAAQVADLVQGEDPDETFRGALAGRFRQRAEDLRDWGAGSKLGALDPEGPEGEDLEPMPSVAYVHLRDVTVLPGSGGATHLDLWRGRLADVAGWSLG
ncbi:MAG TPA: hypothetical protein VFX52_04120 [Nocardioidaceae bacterium]|jgi:hypothetical protein|nr:hypothetical protein [Nocardioidaceae bacterium]